MQITGIHPHHENDRDYVQDLPYHIFTLTFRFVDLQINKILDTKETFHIKLRTNIFNILPPLTI